MPFLAVMQVAAAAGHDALGDGGGGLSRKCLGAANGAGLAPLYSAVEGGHSEAATALLAAGAAVAVRHPHKPPHMGAAGLHMWLPNL